MKISPFQLVVIGFFAFAALAAVGVLSGIITLPKSANQNLSGSVTMWGTIDAKAFQFTENFLKSQNKNISFKYVQKPLANFELLLNEAIASGKGPDLILISQEQILRNKSKLVLQKLDADTILSYKNTYINGAELFLTEEGLVALPLGVNPLVMYYNDRLLTSAGFSKPPQYWDEMETYVDALTVKNDNRDIRQSTLALGTFENLQYPVDILSALILQTGNNIVEARTIYNNDNTTRTQYQSYLSSSASAQVIDFFNAFSNPQKKLYSWNKSLPNDLNAFTSELTTFWFGYPTDISRIEAKNPNLDYKVTSIPQIRNSKNRLTYGKVYGIGILKSSANKSAATFIAQELTRNDAQKVTLEDGGLQYPYRTSIATSKDERSALFARQAIQVAGYYMPSFDFTYTIFNSILNQIASGAIETAQGVERIEAELNNYINKNQLN